jgi:predicted amidohydrolase
VQHQSLRIGIGQLLVEGGEPGRNFERAEQLVAESRKRGCQLVLLPEAMDFGWTHPSALEEAEPIPGRWSDQLCALAREYRLHLCAGITQKTESGNCNTALLISPEGKILLDYQKINLLEVEFPFYKVGKKLGVIDTPLGCIGLNICADNYLDSLSIANVLGRMGAQLILAPSAWTVEHSTTEETDPYLDKWTKPLSTIAAAFDLFFVSATSVGYIVGGPYEGKKMVGRSLAIGPEGLVCQGGFNEFAGELAVAEITLRPRKRAGTLIGPHLREKGLPY